METGSSSNDPPKHNQSNIRPKPSPRPPKIEPFVPRADHNPKELKSWAKRTGFNSSFSGETVSSSGEKDLNELEKESDTNSLSRKIEIKPVTGLRVNNRNAKIEMESISPKGSRDEAFGARDIKKVTAEPVIESMDKKQTTVETLLDQKNARRSELEKEIPTMNQTIESDKDGAKDEREVGIDIFQEFPEPGYPVTEGPSGMKYGLREKIGFVPLLLYGLQHYLSLAGSLVFIPLIMVPAMDGTDEDTATVICTMLLVSGITTILHSYLGTRLPLVQGSSFAFLAPALVITNSQEFRNLSENKFKHIMRELQGAIILGSIFQIFLGYTGLMSLFLRLINPVVVTPTVASVGLAFFSYAFPRAGSCAEISIPHICLVLIFILYLRGVSLFGHRVFRIYSVPLSVAIVWIYAFFLTESGTYDYKDCSTNIPTSNILLDVCRRHVSTMKSCRTDASSALRTTPWVRVPYPFQWGMPTFHFKTSFIMIFVSLIAIVDSVGSYHTASILVNVRTPTPGTVSRGIGIEGFSSLLAGLWGTGTGSTTLNENLHTIYVTKMANRQAISLGAALMILFSFMGKVGALLASIPLALAAAVLCFTWALIAALGLSTLQYSQTVSSRNIIIVGFSLFMSLSVPAYFQQYQPITGLVLPSYFIPYAAASNGPVRLGNDSLSYAINALLSMNMIVAFLTSFILDNTVPGTREERGAYIWSDANKLGNDHSVLEDYFLPKKIRGFFQWVRWVGI